ncbi:MAG: hypothetical protein ACJA1B_001880 [Polaribacter sp.]|jgi:hypothetical protein
MFIESRFLKIIFTLLSFRKQSDSDMGNVLQRLVYET